MNSYTNKTYIFLIFFKQLSMKEFCVTFIIILFSSCSFQKSKKDYRYTHELKSTNEFIEFNLSSDTYMPLNDIFYFKTDSEYIAFKNKDKPELLIYNLKTKKLYKKIIFKTEGANSIIKSIGDFT